MSKNSNFEQDLMSLYKDQKENSVRIIQGKYKVNAQDAEDLFQKSVMKALSNISKFRGDSSIKTWLFRIIHNCFIDYSRSYLTKRPLSIVDSEGVNIIDNIPCENSTPDSCLSEKDRLKLLKQKIEHAKSKLTPIHRKTFELAFEKQLSYSGIALRLKCSQGTVMSRVFYARRSFKRFFHA